MIALFLGFLSCLSTFFRSRYSLGVEILALRQQLGVLKRKNPHPRLRVRDRAFWILLRRLGLVGQASWSLSNRKRLSPGIEKVFAYSGTINHVQRVQAGPKLKASFGVSFGGW